MGRLALSDLRFRATAILCAVLASAMPAAGDTAAMITGLPGVTDGDSLLIGPMRVRLLGIDAPKSGYRCAAADGGDWSCSVDARQALVDLMAGKPLACTA